MFLKLSCNVILIIRPSYFCPPIITGPGHGIQTSSGRLVVPGNYFVRDEIGKLLRKFHVNNNQPPGIGTKEQDDNCHALLISTNC